MRILTFSLFLLLIACDKPLTISDLENPSANEVSSLPRLFTDDNGTVFMSWVEQNADTSNLYYSKFSGDSWQEKKWISGSTDWFVNWADFPSVITQNGKLMAAHWLTKKPGGTYSYDVEVSVPGHESFIVHDDNTPTEHGFVSMQPVSDSSFYAIWLDGRNTAGGSHTGHSSGLEAAMTLRGALINTEGVITSEAEIDDSVCDCCNTSLVSTNNGLLVAYRNRTESEVRDIHLARFTDGEWMKLGSVHDDNWTIAACPVNGPAIDSEEDFVAVAWFTGAGDIARVKLAFSEDKGNNFTNPITIDESDALGRVDVSITENGETWISWLSRTEESARLNIYKYSMKGKVLNSFSIDDINPSRGTGFPQITRFKQGLVIAWTELKENKKSIKTAVIR
jgi:hypothetical protein